MAGDQGQGVQFIVSGYNNGLPGVARGAGPSALLADRETAGLGAIVELEPPDPAEPEIVRIGQLDRRLSTLVRGAVEAGDFPLVLAGDCNSCLGTTAGLSEERRLGVVWFDAHGDFDTPEESLGFFDAMGLAILTGNGWRRLRESIPGFTAIAEEDTLLVGVRDLQPWQRGALEASSIRTLPGARWSAHERDAALEALREHVSRIYLHVDLDALDPSEGTANAFSARQGLRLDQLLEALEATFARFDVAGAAVTAYDPSVDADGRMAKSARRAIGAIVEAAGAMRRA